MITFCTFYSGISLTKSMEITKQIGSSLNWQLLEERDSEVVFSSKFNWDTWGQKISIKYVSVNAVNITVKTRLYQFGDSGSGSATIKEFVERFQEQASVEDALESE